MKSIIKGTQKGICYLCQRSGYTEQHHIFGGANRKLSEKYGLKVFLCVRCHRDNQYGVHADRKKADHLCRIGQAAFERDHTRKEFMEIFKINYLDDVDDVPGQQE